MAQSSFSQDKKNKGLEEPGCGILCWSPMEYFRKRRERVWEGVKAWRIIEYKNDDGSISLKNLKSVHNSRFEILVPPEEKLRDDIW